MTVRSHVVDILTNGSGAATVYTPYITGFIDAIQYVKTDFTNGVDFAITVESTGEAVWTGTNVDAATTVRPRAPTHSVAGVDAVFAAAGEAVMERIAVSRDRIKIVISSGGAAKVGRIIVRASDD